MREETAERIPVEVDGFPVCVRLVPMSHESDGVRKTLERLAKEIVVPPVRKYEERLRSLK
jgi:hypothetical protein